MIDTNGDSGSADREPTDGLERLQYADIYYEDDVPLSDVRENALRAVVYVSGVALVMIVILGAVVDVPREVSLPFVLKGSEPEYVYRFFDPLYVEERYVEVGDTVAAGTPLLRISSPKIVELIAAYESAAERKRIFDEAERAVYESQVEALSLQEDKLERHIGDLSERMRYSENIYEQQRRQRQAVVDQARSDHERRRALHEKMLLSASQLEISQRALVEAESELEGLIQLHRSEAAAIENERTAAEIEKSILSKNREEKARQAANRDATLSSELVTTREALFRNYGDFTAERGSLLLRAPDAGRVSYLTFHERQVEPGSILVKILRDSSTIRAESLVPPRSIGLVNKGAPVSLKVDTYPHYEWGVLYGHISSLSLTPDENGRYPIEIAFDSSGRLASMLSIGMTGELSVLVEEKSVLSYLVHGLKKGYHDIVEG